MDMPKLHKKPSQDELQEGIDKSLKEIEELKDIPSEPVPSEPVPSEPEPTPSEPIPSPEPSKEVIKDIAKREKERLIASAQEAQVLHAKNKKMNEALDKALTTPETTDEEAQAEFPEWEMMSDFEKKMARDSLSNKKRMLALDEIVKENKDLEGWVTKVDAFVDDPATLTKHPELDGKQDEFKFFANKPTRRNIDFEDLVPAFLYGMKPEPKKKGQMFETGSGGPNDKGKPRGDKITIEEARILRGTNYEKYKEYLKSGKIELGEF